MAFSWTCQPKRKDAYAHSMSVFKKSWEVDGLNHNFNRAGYMYKERKEVVHIGRTFQGLVIHSVTSKHSMLMTRDIIKYNSILIQLSSCYTGENNF